MAQVWAAPSFRSLLLEPRCWMRSWKSCAGGLEPWEPGPFDPTRSHQFMTMRIGRCWKGLQWLERTIFQSNHVKEAEGFSRSSRKRRSIVKIEASEMVKKLFSYRRCYCLPKAARGFCVSSMGKIPAWQNWSAMGYWAKQCGSRRGACVVCSITVGLIALMNHCNLLPSFFATEPT